MKRVVQINTVCGSGSTGRIAMNLYHTQKQAGYEPMIVFGRGEVPEGINAYKMSSKPDFYRHVIRNFMLGESGFGSKKTTFKMVKYLETVKPDVIHLHNIHGFYLNIEVLFDYIKRSKTPVIWTLHDCWSFTGQCANFEGEGCRKWEKGCNHCPIYRTDYPYSLFKDNSYHNYLRKKEIFGNVENMTIVTPSNWLAGLVKQSFLKDYPVKVIHNGIDTECFRYQEGYPEILLEKGYGDLGFKKILLGVANIWEKRKGLAFFFKMADRLDDSYRIVLVGLSAAQQKEVKRDYSHRIIPLERTQNIMQLVELYNIAYVFLNPTIDDNFPTTNLEALACGTPVITFDTGGSKESLDSSCGIVVEKGDWKGMLEAVYSLEENSNITRDDCRKRVMKYRRELANGGYMELYEEIACQTHE